MCIRDRMEPIADDGTDEDNDNVAIRECILCVIEDNFTRNVYFGLSALLCLRHSTAMSYLAGCIVA